MKKGKLLFLLIAVLSLMLLLVACDNKKEPEDTTDTSESAESSEQSGETQQEEVKHELHDYFDLSKEEVPAFTKVTQLKGEIVDVDYENNLIALKTQDLNVKNEVVDTITVYDYITEEVIRERSVSNLLGETRREKRVDLQVKIDYPIIQVQEIRYSEDSDNPNYSIDYYFAKKDGSLIRQTNKPNYEKTVYQNGLVAIDMGEDTLWIDRNMEIVRTAASVAANGYNIECFNCEYQGYLYAWDDSRVQVFNLDGFCSGDYEIEHDGMLNVNVLDNGNVLIQDIEIVDSYEPYEFKAYGSCAVMKSYVMNFVDGSLKEVELDYIVDSIGTRYAERYGDEYDQRGGRFPFALAAGKENQAIIYRVANGKIAVDEEYVVMNNDLTIEYTVENTVAGREFYLAQAITKNLYAMPVLEGGTYQSYIFDLDGNMIAPIGDFFDVTDKYIVTDYVVYDHNMKAVFDNSNGDFDDVYVDEALGRIYFSKHNFTTGAEEIYLFNDESKKPELWNDGTKFVFGGSYSGGYYATDPEENLAKFFNAKDEVLLTVHDNLDAEFEYDYAQNELIVNAEFDGNAVVFIIK